MIEKRQLNITLLLTELWQNKYTQWNIYFLEVFAFHLYFLCQVSDYSVHILIFYYSLTKVPVAVYAVVTASTAFSFCICNYLISGILYIQFKCNQSELWCMTLWSRSWALCWCSLVKISSNRKSRKETRWKKCRILLCC